MFSKKELLSTKLSFCFFVPSHAFEGYSCGWCVQVVRAVEDRLSDVARRAPVRLHIARVNHIDIHGAQKEMEKHGKGEKTNRWVGKK